MFAKSENKGETKCAVVKSKDCFNNLSDFVQHNNSICSFSGSDSWVILSPIELSIKRKIEAVGTPLKDWDIQINYGIKTGCNEAFIISGEKKDEILSNCLNEDEREKTAELIRPILRGRDIKRYSAEFADLWLINTHNGVRGKFPRIDINEYPAVKAHLDQYWTQIEKRADQGDTPYNLRNCAYMEDFLKPKIIWKRIGSILRFSYDETFALGLDSTCFATGLQIKYLTAILNSKMGHYLMKDSPKTGTGDLLISVQAIEPLKIPIPTMHIEKELCYLLDEIMQNGETNQFCNNINEIIYNLYGLSNEEANFINE